MKSLESQIAELTESAKQKDAEITRLQGVVASADKTVASAKLAEMCKEAALPVPAVEKLTLAFKDAVNTNGMQEAVNVEKKYVETIKESAGVKIVRNNGATIADTTEATSTARMTELKEAQKKAFMANGYDEKTAKAIAGIE
jgi:hypothetical protein